MDFFLEQFKKAIFKKYGLTLTATTLKAAREEFDAWKQEHPEAK
jgi:hypothetical protein